MLPPSIAAAARLLRATCPPRKPVRLRLVDLPPDRWADCTERSSHYLIRLHRAATIRDPGMMAYLLLHEWAHALTPPGEAADHGPAFGDAYARVCRAYALD